LITGGWWQAIRIYLNSGGTFTTTPQYTSTSTSVVEVIVMGDVDKDAIHNVQEVFVSDGLIKLFYMPRTPLQSLSRVIVDTDTLQYNQYCYDLENGWVMLAEQPDSGANILIEASVSWDIDMGITNWDQSKGNYLFLNTSDPVFVNTEENLLEGFLLYQNYPNPFNPSTNIGFRIYDGGFVSLKVFDILGNEVATLVDEYKPAGSYEVEFSASSGIRNLPAGRQGLVSGIYFYQLRTGSFVQTKKMVLLK